MSEPQCPNGCGEMEAEYVHNGLGMQRCGPYGCPACYYVEPEAYTLLAESGMEPVAFESTETDEELRARLKGLGPGPGSGDL